MSEDKRPRFLQQTTSQLLHQQEALRKRREMLERESTKPPAMRFGTTTPPRSAGRRVTSPVPISSASDRNTSHLAMAPGCSVHRELKWSRCDDERTVERAPMRFSMTFRPAPTPAVLAGARSAVNYQTTCSPSPREVNTSDQKDAMFAKIRKDVSTPRTISPRSPVSQRIRVERERTPNTTLTRGTPGTPQILTHHLPSRANIPAVEATGIEDSVVSTSSATPARAAVMLPRSPTECPPQELPVGEQDTTAADIAAPSNTFAVPRFTPVSPVMFSSRKWSHQVNEVKQNTPERRSVSEFRTPRALTCVSSAVTPVICSSASPEGEGADHHAPVVTTAEVKTASRASPVPTRVPLVPVVTSAADNLEQGANRMFPAIEDPAPIIHDSVDMGGRQGKEKFLPTTSVGASPARGTTPWMGRSKNSPSPTTHDLIHSVQVSAEKRPCVCERSMPPSENWGRRCTTTPTRSHTVSPPPTPVASYDLPMTDFGLHTHKCCDRPTPVSLSSLPGGGDVRDTTTGTLSASPWPTTENIISSILAVAHEGQRRGKRDTTTCTDGEGDDGASDRFSNEAPNEFHLEAPHAAAFETLYPNKVRLDINEEDEKRMAVSGNPLSAKASAEATAHTPSPVPSQREYGQSFLASTEKRCCGRPTPSVRHVSLPGEMEKANGAVEPTSASPQPSPRHLLHSLDVSIDKCTHREKRTDRSTGTEEGESGGATAEETVRHITALRTPSPTPTPENVIASLQASAEKRKRSGAVDASSGSGGVRAAAATTWGGSSNLSPTFTPQNVKESVQQLFREHQEGLRSDAPAPTRPWRETTTGVVKSASFASTGNSPASPVVTAECVDKTLETLERDGRYQSRFSHASHDCHVSREETNGTAPRDSVVPHVNSEEVTMLENISAVPVSSSELNAAPSVASPAPSDFAAASAMFFDCVSAPPTPALENVMTAKRSPGSEAVIGRRESDHVPPQYFELQREITAISQGRSQTRTPQPSLPRVNESHVPLATLGMILAEEDTPRAEASMEKAERAMSTPPPESKSETLTHCTAAEDEKDDEVVARRSSLILVHPTTTSRALLQHPHEEMPESPPPSMSLVQVPRTPTPPPPNSVRSAHFESPLPRPVSLRSQVSLPKPSPASHKYPTSASRTPARVVQGSPSATGSGMSIPPPRTAGHIAFRRTSAVTGINEREEQADMLDPENDWMDLVETLRPQTITVSPQAGTVMYTAHHSTVQSNVAYETPVCDSPSLPRKRSCTEQTPTPTSRQIGVATPASIALTMDEGSSSDIQSVRAATTPNSHASQTPRSSTRGRKSCAEELLEMLPAEVVAEVTRMQEAEDLEATSTEPSSSPAKASCPRLSTGSPGGKSSGVSDGDSIDGQVSTISQRVSQRPRRVFHNNDYYIQYLEGIATSSATKARKVAARRVHRSVTKDIARGQTKAAEVNSSHLQPNTSASGSPASSPGVYSCPSQSTSPIECGRAVSRSQNSSPISSEHHVSMQTRSPMGGVEGCELKVSTRLSAELEKALFEQPHEGRRKRQTASKNPPPVAPANPTESAKEEAKSSVKRGGARKRSRKQKTSKKSSGPSRGKKSMKKFVTAKSIRVPRRSTRHGKS